MQIDTQVRKVIDTLIYGFEKTERVVKTQFLFDSFPDIDQIVERIYIFPVEEILNHNNTKITINPSKGFQWYEKYRVKNEETLKIINDI